MIYFIFGHLLCAVPFHVHRDFSRSEASDPTFFGFYQYYIKMNLHFSDHVEQRHFHFLDGVWKSSITCPHKFTNYCHINALDSHLATCLSARLKRDWNPKTLCDLYTFWVTLGTGRDVMWHNGCDVYFGKREHLGVKGIKLLFVYFKRLNRKYLYFKRRIMEYAGKRYV